MTVRLGYMTFTDWVSLPYEGGWTDTFVYRVSSQACLPPFAYAPIIKHLTTLKVRNLRKSMSLWVRVDAPGEWFGIELLHALRSLQVPYAVTDGRTPEQVDFSYPPWLGVSNSGRPPDMPDEPSLVSPEELLCLQALGRMVKGDADEIASLAGLSVGETTRMLLDLERRELVAFRTGHRLMRGRRREIESMPDPVPLWHITRRGTSLALRGWGVPRGASFDTRARQEQFLHLIPGKHRSISRQWPAWLQAAWPQAEIWTAWAEVKLPKPLKTVPDALAWGRIQGYETLFWLEVGDNHKSRIRIEDDMRVRLRDALLLAKRTNVRLVFAFLGPKWVQDAASWAFERLPEEVGVVMAGWMKFGKLPVLEWGRVMRR
jgi:hypothetical protein